MRSSLKDVVLTGMALAVGPMVVPGSAGAAPDFYVTPAGDDANPGTRDKPLQSFAGARDAVRRKIAEGMTQDILMEFAAGNYFTRATTTFDERDSGRDGQDNGDTQSDKRVGYPVKGGG